MTAAARTRRIHLSTIAGALAFVVIVVRAVRTVDPYWDTLAYHWAFAARAAGLCDADCFSLTSDLEARYDGFPLLMHAAQGWLWRLTGTPAFGDLFNVAALAALAGYLRWRFDVPLAWGWLALFAIPEVQIQLTSSYVDVPVNAMATIAILVVVRMLIDPAADHRADVAIALAALGVASASKFLAVPVALVTWCAIVALATRSAHVDRASRRWWSAAALAAAGIVVLLPKEALNLYAYGNPFYPIAFDAGPLHFAGPESTHQPNTISTYWADTPAALRWIVSVAEFDAFRGRPWPWLIGQGDVPASSPAFRMGGYFVAYVLGALAVLAWHARASASGVRAVAVMLALSALCMLLPNSSELRYYVFWMMALVALALAGAHSPLFADVDQPARRRAAHALVAIAAASVVSMTGAAFVRTHGHTLNELLAETADTVARTPDGGTLCIRNADRRAFLYAEVFHPGRHYHTRELRDDEPAACTLRVTLP